MLDDYFPQPDDEDVYPSWRDIDFGSHQDWTNFKNKWLRHEKIEETLG